MKKHETLLVSTILNGTYRGRRFLQMVGMVGLFSFGSVQGLHAEAVNPSADGTEVVQQKKNVTGVVKDKTGEPVIGANVIVKRHYVGCDNGYRRTLYDFCRSRAGDRGVVYRFQDLRFSGRLEVGIYRRSSGRCRVAGRSGGCGIWFTIEALGDGCHLFRKVRGA